MATELFSTSLPHSSEVEVKKGFIQACEPEPPARNHDDHDRYDTGGAQASAGNNERDERDGWQETQPTLRERSARHCALTGRRQKVHLSERGNKYQRCSDCTQNI